MYAYQNDFKTWLNTNPSRKKNLPHWEEFFKFNFKEMNSSYLYDSSFAKLWQWEQERGQLFSYLEIYREWYVETGKLSSLSNEGCNDPLLKPRLNLIAFSRNLYQQLQEIKELKGKKQELEKKVQETQQELTQTKQNEADKTKKIERLESKLKLLEEAKTKLETESVERIRQLKQEITELQKKLTELKDKIQQSEQEKKKLQEQLKQEENKSTSYQGQADTLNSEVANKEQEITEWRRKIEKYEDQILSYQTQLSLLEQREKKFLTANQTQSNWWIDQWKKYKHHLWWLIPLVLLAIVILYLYKKFRKFSN